MTDDLSLQKRLAADVLKVGLARVRFDPARLNDIKQAITKEDIRLLVKNGGISSVQKKGVSRVRARKTIVQKRKGLRKGPGSSEGKKTARNPRKEAWMAKVRAQRRFLKELKTNGILSSSAFKELYRKSKGGFFRSIRHIKLVMNERKMTEEKR